MNRHSILINIGLNVHDGEVKLHPQFVSGVVYAHDLRAIDMAVHQSATEATLVIAFDDRALDLSDLRQRIYSIAEMLAQDCIAVYWPVDDSGALIGPRAADWGDFQKKYFLQLDGSFLA